MTINHRPEHGTGPSDAQLLDYLRRGAVHTPDGTVIGWVPPTPAVGTGSLTYNDVDGLACRECGTDLLRPGEGDALPWREIRGIIDSHTASQHQAHSGIHPLPEYEPPARPHPSTSPVSTHEPDPTRAELIAFLRARLDEDEQTAREAAVWWGDSDEPGEAPHWRPVPCGHIWNDHDGSIADEVADRHAAHIARHDPARVLADVESKRRIIDLHKITVEKLSVPPYDEMTGDPNPDEYDAYCAVCGYVWVNNDPTQACMTLRLLAEPYADHPDYRDEWRP
jgi:hypothetical protein